MSDFKELSNIELQDVQDMCSSVKWNQGSNPQDLINNRFDIMVKLEKIYAAHEGRPPQKLILDSSLPNNVAGIAANDGLHISTASLGSNKDVDRYDAISTVIHEGRHAYQRYCVSQSNGLSNDKLPEQVRKWKENENEYMLLPDKAHAQREFKYRFQSVERDAYSFETKEADRIFAGQTDYADFRKYWDNQKSQLEQQAQQSYGNGYEEKIDCAIKHQYLMSIYGQLHDQLAKNGVSVDKDIVNGMGKEYTMYSDLKNQDPQAVKKQQRDVEDNIMRMAKDNHINIVPVRVDHDDIREKINKTTNVVPDKMQHNDPKEAKDKITDSVKNGDISSKDTTIHPTKIGDLRKTLNGQMDEINKQLKELNQERRQVEGAPLTKEQAEKLAASNHLSGADKELDKQAQELQSKKDKLSQYEKDAIAFGKEHGLDTTLWRHAPEIFKGEGLKHYEGAMATVENNTKVYDQQATEIQAKRDQHQEQLQTPEAKSEIAKNSEEILVQDKERLGKLEGLDQKINELTNEKHDIMTLRDIIPSRKLDKEIDVQGDPKNVQNLLRQTDQLKQQATEMQQAQALTSGQGLSL